MVEGGRGTGRTGSWHAPLRPHVNPAASHTVIHLDVVNPSSLVGLVRSAVGDWVRTCLVIKMKAFLADAQCGQIYGPNTVICSWQATPNFNLEKKKAAMNGVEPGFRVIAP